MSRQTIQCAATKGPIIYEGDRFKCDTPEEVKAMLEKEGVAVLQNTLNGAEIEAVRTGMWDTLEWLTSTQPTPLARGKPETYSAAKALMPNHGSLFQGWVGLAHRQHIWDVRQNPRVVETFARIWDCAPTDLLTSMDATSMGVAHLATPKATGFERGNVWLHMDQAPIRHGFECVQAWVTAEDVEAGDATLRVLVGSHNFKQQFSEHFDNYSKEDWYRLNDAERAWYAEQGCEDVRIMLPAGGMVLWDSRLVHSGAAPLKEAPNPKPRNIVYVCMQPRMGTPGMELTTKQRIAALTKAIKKRKEIFNPESKFYGRMTTHWPVKTKLFGKFPRAYGPKPDSWETIPPSPMPKLTPLGRRIAGLD